MVKDKTLKKCRIKHILRQILYLAFVLFFWIRLLSKGYTDIGTIFALIMITLFGLMVSQYDVLLYLKQVDDYYKDKNK